MIALQHDNTNLFEVLATAGGIQAFSKGDKIRIIRGDLKNPSVQIVDVTTLEGIMAADLTIRPNDIIYVEPGRRVFVQAFSDYNPFIATILGTTSIFLSTLIAIRAFSR
jgi:polysaccharide biosynthesis/export protein